MSAERKSSFIVDLACSIASLPPECAVPESGFWFYGNEDFGPAKDQTSAA